MHKRGQRSATSIALLACNAAVTTRHTSKDKLQWPGPLQHYCNDRHQQEQYSATAITLMFRTRTATIQEQPRSVRGRQRSQSNDELADPQCAIEPTTTSEEDIPANHESAARTLGHDADHGILVCPRALEPLGLRASVSQWLRRESFSRRFTVDAS